MDRRKLLFFGFVLAMFMFSFLYIKNKSLFVDEQVHYLQIKRFNEGDLRIYDIITVIPGYHYSLSVFSKIFNVSSEEGIRFFNSLIGLGSIFLFLLVAYKIQNISSFRKSLEYAFFPILFPFFFLIYTDVLSLFLVLLMIYFIFLDRYNLAGVVGIMSFFVRQNNVIWILFSLFLVYVKLNGYKYNFKNVLEVLEKCKIMVLGLVIGLIFFILNKGFVLGDKEMHSGGFYLGNIFFILFLFFFLFLPLNLYNFFKIKEYLSRNRFMWIVIAGIFIIYMKFFNVAHPYNFLGMDYFLRNEILQYFNDGNIIKSILFLPIAYSILSLCVVKLLRKEFYLIYPFSILLLIPSLLIEQRYYLVPFSLFILFKKEDNKWINRVSIGIYIILSIVLLYLIGKETLFL